MSKSLAIPSTNQLTSASPALAARFRKRHTGASAFTLDIDLSIPAGFTILFGASGAGKTTLLDCVAGLQSPDDGMVAIGPSVLFDSTANVNVAPRRRSVAYLLQSLALFPHMTVGQNVQYGLASLSPADRD